MTKLMISPRPDLSGPPLGLEEVLLLLLVDGAQDVEELLDELPCPRARGEAALQYLRHSGYLLDPGSAPPPPSPAEGPELGFRLDKPPRELMDACPRLSGATDPAKVATSVEEYYLLSRIDGFTRVENLRSLANLTMDRLVLALLKHHRLGTLSFDEPLERGLLAALHKSLETQEPRRRPASVDLALRRLLADPVMAWSLSGVVPELREAPAVEAARRSLSNDECLVLARVNGSTAVAEIIKSSERPKEDTLDVLFGLFGKRVITLKNLPATPARPLPPPDPSRAKGGRTEGASREPAVPTAPAPDAGPPEPPAAAPPVPAGPPPKVLRYVVPLPPGVSEERTPKPPSPPRTTTPPPTRLPLVRRTVSRAATAPPGAPRPLTSESPAPAAAPEGAASKLPATPEQTPSGLPAADAATPAAATATTPATGTPDAPSPPAPADVTLPVDGAPAPAAPAATAPAPAAPAAPPDVATRTITAIPEALIETEPTVAAIPLPLDDEEPPPPLDGSLPAEQHGATAEPSQPGIPLEDLEEGADRASPLPPTTASTSSPPTIRPPQHGDPAAAPRRQASPRPTSATTERLATGQVTGRSGVLIPPAPAAASSSTSPGAGGPSAPAAPPAAAERAVLVPPPPGAPATPAETLPPLPTRPRPPSLLERSSPGLADTTILTGAGGPLAGALPATTPSSRAGQLPEPLLAGEPDPGWEQRWGAVPAAGDLADRSFAVIHSHIAGVSATGIFHVRRGVADRTFYYLRGIPVFAVSNVAQESLGSVLWRANLIAREAYLELERLVHASPTPAWQILQSLLHLVPDEVEQAQALQFQAIFARAQTLNTGEYWFVGKRSLPPDVPVLQLDAMQGSPGAGQALGGGFLRPSGFGPYAGGPLPGGTPAAGTPIPPGMAAYYGQPAGGLPPAVNLSQSLATTLPGVYALPQAPGSLPGMVPQPPPGFFPPAAAYPAAAPVVPQTTPAAGLATPSSASDSGLLAMAAPSGSSTTDGRSITSLLSPPEGASGERPIGDRSVTTELLAPKEKPTDIPLFVRNRLDFFGFIPKPRLDLVRKLKLGNREMRLIEALGEGTRRIRELLAISSLGRSKSEEFIVALYTKGYLEITEEQPVKDEQAETLDTMRKYLVRLEKSDHFEALDIHPSATVGDIEKAYQLLIARYDEKKFQNASPEMQRSAKGLRNRIQKAYDVLKEKETRQQYRLKTYGELKVRMYADVQYKKGDNFLFWRNNPWEAKPVFESAFDLMPSEGLYVALWGYATYRSDPTVKEAIKEGWGMVQEGIRMSPKSPHVYGVAARFEMDRTNLSQARDLLKKAQQRCTNPQMFNQIVAAYQLQDLVRGSAGAGEEQ